jgi:3-hydroxyacyl-CoA dehydrogenase
MTEDRVAVIGTGVIGSSWAAYFLASGLDVRASDPAPGAEGRLRAAVVDAWPALESLGLAAGASQERLTFVADPAEAVHNARFVQESGPEAIELKSELFEILDEVTPPQSIIASSSSGLLPSQIQSMCRQHPERVVVGHPFNPAHLIPLVEVVGGDKSSDTCIERAMSFYEEIGKRPIRVATELKGHIANRLQAALWREAYSLVERGAATVADIDTAISYGPGLRWALLGPLLNQHLSGGAGGLRHVLSHLGPPTQVIMDDLGAPRLSESLAEKLVAGVDEELSGLDLTALTAGRDALLLELLVLKAGCGALP